MVIGNLNIKGIAVDETEADSPLARGPFSEAAYIPELVDPQGEVGQGGFLLPCVR